MSRTRLRQVEQIRSSETYADGYTMGVFAETAPTDLEEDLNYIRSQLRILNDPSNGGTTNWYDAPVDHAIDMFASSTSTAFAAGTAIDVGGNFDAGTPFDLTVYLNGVALVPSVITGSTVTTEYDYQEVDSDGINVSTGVTGRAIKINFDIISGDILQFVWTV